MKGTSKIIAAFGVVAVASVVVVVIESRSLVNHDEPLATILESGTSGYANGGFQSNIAFFRSYKFLLFRDGSVVVSDSFGHNMTFPSSTIDAGALDSVLAQVSDVEMVRSEACKKSWPSEITTQIIYHGKTSGDLRCPAKSWPKRYYELRDLVADILDQLRLPLPFLSSPPFRATGVSR